MITTAFNGLFGPMAVFYGLVLPVVTAQFIAILLLPALIRGSKTVDGGRACFYIIAEGLGVILMALGGLPTLASVLARVALPAMTYASLLLTFVIGGLVFLRHDHLLHQIDAASRAVPETIAFFTWKAIGLLLAVLGFVYLLVYVLLSNGNLSGNWWALPCTVLFFGILLLWATSHDGSHHSTQAFTKAPVQKKVVPAKKKK